MKKNFLKLSLIIAFAIFGISKGHAFEVSVSDFSIGPGQVQTVKIIIKNAPTDDPITSGNFDFDLPEDVNVVGVDPSATGVEAPCTTNAAAFAYTNFKFVYNSSKSKGKYKITFAYFGGDQCFIGNTQTADGDWIVAFDLESKATEKKEGSIVFTDDTELDGDEAEWIQGETLTIPDAAVAISDKFTATMAASGYTSICSTTDLDFSGVEDLTAYVVSKAEGGKATLTEIENAPANTGVILKGAAGTTYEIPTGSATAPDANLLKGVTAATTIKGDGSQFFLVGGKFVKAANPATLPAGKAYLAASAGAKAFDVLEFDFDGDATAIQNVEKEQFDGAIYNLNGVRVDNPTKGVYVKDGKKFVVK